MHADGAQLPRVHLQCRHLAADGARRRRDRHLRLRLHQRRRRPAASLLLGHRRHVVLDHQLHLRLPYDALAKTTMREGNTKEDLLT